MSIRKIIIGLSVVFVLIGMGAVLYGTHMKDMINSAEAVSIEALSSDDIGRFVSVVIDPNELIEGGEDLYCIQINISEEDYLTVPVRGYEPGSAARSTSGVGNDGYVTFRVTKTPDGTSDVIAITYREMYKDNLEKLYALRDNGIPEGSTITPEFLEMAIAVYEEAAGDEGYRSVTESVTGYELDVANTGFYDLLIFVGKAAAIVMLFVFAGAFLSGRIKLRKLIAGIATLIVIAVFFACFMIRDDIRTMLSLKEYAPDIYTIHVSNDYMLEKILEDGTYNENSLIKWVSENMFWNLPMVIDLPKFGCASFTCETPDGTHIFGRNYDFQYTDPIIIYTEPENGYRSMAVSDLAMMNLAGPLKRYEPDSLYGRAILRAVPFLTSDGVNEAGLGISILSVGYTDMSQNTGKTGLYLPVGVRAILDTCANVDEAVELLESYDIKAMIGWSYHLFITDKSGRAVVAEWVDGELVITEAGAVTNFLMSAEEHKYCDLFDTITSCLSGKENVLTYNEAMQLLMDSGQASDDISTQWSCVYDLDNFQMYFVSDRDISNIFHITPDSF
ncbi:MAG: linear amide C-N hydrolase [Lachnospiraceae bacterium]|nr:linear amide C-N hydrolase [Lachnospiraceae bacterium]